MEKRGTSQLQFSVALVSATQIESRCWLCAQKNESAREHFLQHNKKSIESDEEGLFFFTYFQLKFEKALID